MRRRRGGKICGRRVFASGRSEGGVNGSLRRTVNLNRVQEGLRGESLRGTRGMRGGSFEGLREWLMKRIWNEVCLRVCEMGESRGDMRSRYICTDHLGSPVQTLSAKGIVGFGCISLTLQGGMREHGVRRGYDQRARDPIA